MRIVRPVALNDRAVDQVAEAAVAEHMLPSELEAVDVGRRPVDDAVEREHGIVARVRIDHALRYESRSAVDDEVRHVLQVDVGRQVGVFVVVPFGGDVDVVGEERQQVRIAAGGRQRALTAAVGDGGGQVADRRPSHRPRRIEPQMEGVGHVEADVEVRQQIGVGVLDAEDLRVGQQEIVRGKITRCDDHRLQTCAEAGCRHIGVFPAHAATDLHRHFAKLGVGREAGIEGVVVFKQLLILRFGFVGHQARNQTVEARRIGKGAAVDAVGSRNAPDFFALGIEGVRATDGRTDLGVQVGIDVIGIGDRQTRNHAALGRRPTGNTVGVHRLDAMEQTRRKMEAGVRTGSQRVMRIRAVTGDDLPVVVGAAEQVRVGARDEVVRLILGADLDLQTGIVDVRFQAGLVDEVGIVPVVHHHHVGTQDAAVGRLDRPGRGNAEAREIIGITARTDARVVRQTMSFDLGNGVGGAVNAASARRTIADTGRDFLEVVAAVRVKGGERLIVIGNHRDVVVDVIFEIDAPGVGLLDLLAPDVVEVLRPKTREGHRRAVFGKRHVPHIADTVPQRVGQRILHQVIAGEVAVDRDF
jgi:hypothetical protein